MKKQNKNRNLQIFVLGLIILLFSIPKPVNAAISIETPNLDDVQFIVPYSTSFQEGYLEKLAIGPDGSYHVIYEYGVYADELYYMTNKSGSWSEAEMIYSPQGGILRPDIVTDSTGKVHIAVPHNWDGGAYLTDKTGEWVIDTSMGGRYSPRIAIGPDDVPHFIYHNIKLSDNDFLGCTYTNGTIFDEPLLGSEDNNNTDNLQEIRPVIAVDSTGLVHIAIEGQWNNTALGNTAVRDIFYQTFNPNKSEDQFSEIIKISDTVDTRTYAECPEIVSDSDDNIHISYLQTNMVEVGGINVSRGSRMYIRLDDSISTDDLQVVNTIRTYAGVNSMDVDSDGNVHMVYFSGPQTEITHYYTHDIVYATNISGDWVEERLTNQPYNVRLGNIAINPTTNEPVVILGMKDYVSTNFTIQILEKRDGRFGPLINVSASISGETIEVIEEEAYQYVQVESGSECDYNISVENPLGFEQDLGITFEFIHGEEALVNLVSGDVNRSLDSIGVAGEINYNWGFSTMRAQATQIIVKIMKGSSLVGIVSFFVNIESGSLNIPGFTLFSLIAVSTISIGVKITKIKRKQ
ncbi:MAG: hypothetical protein ACTSQ5_09270 [Promethearchaeota archaeon]